MYYQNPAYLLPEVEYDTVTDGLTGKYIFMPYAQAVTVEEREDITVDSLLTTSDSAISKTDLANAQSYEKEEGDLDGPFNLAVCAQRQLDEGSAVLYLFASGDLFTDNANSMVADANLTLFNNTTAAMSDNPVSISVPVKSYETSDILVNEGTALAMGGVMMILIPVCLLLAGILVCMGRRKR